MTVHDILFETHPQFFTPLFRARSRHFVRQAVAKADHVFTVSQFSRNELRRLYGAPSDRLSVIYNGVAYDRFSQDCDEDSTVLKRWGLIAGRYLLSVGRLEPRKNHETLVRAYARLDSDTPPLILVGQKDFKFDGVFRAIRELRLEQRVRVFETVSDQDLPALYRHAIVFAYLSVAEGFGMPVLEAMAAGTPVVTCNVTAIEEIVRPGGARLVSPFNVEEIAATLHALVQSHALRVRLSAIGRERARLFTWESSARILRRRYWEMVR